MPARLAAALLEPVRRNTALGFKLVALHAREGGNAPMLVVTSADHLIPDQQALLNAMHVAITQGEHGRIAIPDIAPDRSETRYSYINTHQHGANRAVEVSQDVKYIVAAQQKDKCEEQNLHGRCTPALGETRRIAWPTLDTSRWKYAKCNPAAIGDDDIVPFEGQYGRRD